MADHRIKAVVFDLGETLLTFGRVDTHGVFGEAARLTYDFLRDCEQPVPSFGVYKRHNFLVLRWRYWQSSMTGKDFDSLELLKKINRRYGVELEDAQWEKLVQLWYEPLKKLGRPESDIVGTLSNLKAAGLKLGIVSNTFVHRCCLEPHLAEFGMLEFFDAILFSYEFPFRKPDPRILIKAADALGVRLPNAMYVGDRIDNDIKPALFLDMTPVLKTAYTNANKKTPKNTRRINHLSELPALIEKLNED